MHCSINVPHLIILADTVIQSDFQMKITKADKWFCKRKER